MTLQELWGCCLLLQFTQMQKGETFLSGGVLCRHGKQLKYPEFTPQLWPFTSLAV